MTPPTGPSSGPSPRDAVRARLELPCQLLQLRPPPSVVALRLLQRPQGWSLILLSDEGAPGTLQGWLDRHPDLPGAGETTVHGAAVAVEMDRLPPGLDPLGEDLRLEQLILEPDGTARMVLHGARTRLQALVQELSAPEAEARVRSITPAERDPAAKVLTGRQLEVLMQASARGYYDVPRQISLRDLADELGASPAALSELLRRTEARLVDGFLDAISTSPEAPMTALAAHNQLFSQEGRDG